MAATNRLTGSVASGNLSIGQSPEFELLITNLRARWVQCSRTQPSLYSTSGDPQAVTRLATAKVTQVLLWVASALYACTLALVRCVGHNDVTKSAIDHA